MKSKYIRTTVRGERGAAMLEFGVTVPFLLLLIAGVIDLSGWMNAHMSVSRVAYEGARYIASAPLVSGQGADIDNRMTRLLERYGLQGAQTSYEVVDSNAIRVQVNMPYTFIFAPATVGVHASAQSAYLYRQ